MPTDPRAIPGLLKALRDFFDEYGKEDERPHFLEFPNDEWEALHTANSLLVYRRKETETALHAFRTKFERKEWVAKWSIGYIRQLENSLIDIAYRGADDAQLTAAFQNALNAMDEEPKKFISILPVAHLHLGRYEIQFTNVKLQTIDDAKLAEIRQRYFDIIATTRHTEEEKEALNQRAIAATELLRNRACAFVSVVGDKDRAKTTAEQDVENVLDFLQFAALILEPAFKKIRIAIGGDLLAEQPGRLLMAEDGSAIHDEHEVRHAFRLQFDAAGMEKLRTHGFTPLIDALGKPASERTDFESLLIRAMHWTADADRQSLAENKITSYVTAIDMFFATKGEPVTRDVTEGTAVLLGKDLANRKKIAKRMSEFYEMRSLVSHAGEAMDAKAIAEIRYIALNFLAVMCLHASRFKNKQEFRSWMADQRLNPIPQPETNLEPVSAAAPDDEARDLDPGGTSVTLPGSAVADGSPLDAG